MTDQHPYTPSVKHARDRYIEDGMRYVGVGTPLVERIRYRLAMVAEFDRMIEAVRAEERERCAQIAESTKPIGHYNGFAQWGNDPHVRIAARIREQGEGQGND